MLEIEYEGNFFIGLVLSEKILKLNLFLFKHLSQR